MNASVNVSQSWLVKREPEGIRQACFGAIERIIFMILWTKRDVISNLKNLKLRKL